MRTENKRRIARTAALMAAVAGVIGASAAPSLAYQPDRFDGVYAHGSHKHVRHARHASHPHKGGPQLTYFYEDGKLHLVNTDRNGGLEGEASVYEDRMTASGEHMDPNAMTAAHKSLPMGTIVTVHDKQNGRAVTVRINDRGPYVTGRVIDLSPGAARVIGLDGLGPVSLTVDPPGTATGPGGPDETLTADAGTPAAESPKPQSSATTAQATAPASTAPAPTTAPSLSEAATALTPAPVATSRPTTAAMDYLVWPAWPASAATPAQRGVDG